MEPTLEYYEVELIEVAYSIEKDVFCYPTSNTLRVNMTHSTLENLRSQIMKPIPDKPKVYFAEGGGDFNVGYFVKEIIRGYYSRLELEKHFHDTKEYLDMFNGIVIKNVFNMCPPAFYRAFSMANTEANVLLFASNSIKAYDDFFSRSHSRPSSYGVMCPPVDMTIKVDGNDFTFDFRNIERVFYIDNKCIVDFREGRVEFNTISEEDVDELARAFIRFYERIGVVGVSMKPKFERTIEGKTLCFTGHRPDKLNGYKKEDNLDLINALYCEIESAIKDGVETFISGMALGVDMWSAETVIELRKKYDHIKLVCAIPCKNHPAKWGQESKRQ